MNDLTVMTVLENSQPLLKSNTSPGDDRVSTSGGELNPSGKLCYVLLYSVST